jgi:hypothetical protein
VAKKVWQLKEPNPVKLVIGILAADKKCLDAAVRQLADSFGDIDFISDVFPFTQTDYYKQQTGENILRQFVSIAELIDPTGLPDIKHKTNSLEKLLADSLKTGFPRPVNLDPGVVEPSKLVLVTTKNYSHRIYIGKNMYAEVTLIFDKGMWQPLPYTYPDYKQACYHNFFNIVRNRLVEQLKSKR